MYEMTRDGFTFLVMGFTGREAGRFKEAYIAAFNRLEQAVSQPTFNALEQHLIDQVEKLRQENDALKTELLTVYRANLPRRLRGGVR